MGHVVYGGLSASGLINQPDSPLAKEVVIPMFDPSIAYDMLQQNGSLSILTINASSYQNMAIEYGIDVYRSLQSFLTKTLFELWGKPGCFRKRCSLSTLSQLKYFHIILEPARGSSRLPGPGDLEKMSDRLAVKIHNLMWRDLFKPRAERALPLCLNHIPQLSIGYATALHNPCVDVREVVDGLLQTSYEVGQLQKVRLEDRQREVIQTLITRKNMIRPNFQVFCLPGLTDETIKQSRDEKTQAMEPWLFGFESLIRVNQAQADKIMNKRRPCIP